MDVFIERSKTTETLNFSGTVLQLLEHLHINSEDVLVICNGVLVTEDEPIENTDTIRLLSVVSGG